MARRNYADKPQKPAKTNSSFGCIKKKTNLCGNQKLEQITLIESKRQPPNDETVLSGSFRWVLLKKQSLTADVGMILGRWGRSGVAWIDRRTSDSDRK
jgi:hypothetical protein